MKYEADMIVAGWPAKSTAADRAPAAAEPGTLVLVCLAAWAVPGAGHLWLGRRQKALVFLVALTAMFVDRPAAARADLSVRAVRAARRAGGRRERRRSALPWLIARITGVRRRDR